MEVEIPPERNIIFSVVCLIFCLSTKQTSKSIKTPTDSIITTIVPVDVELSGFFVAGVLVGEINVSVVLIVPVIDGSIDGEVGRMTGEASVVTLKVSENIEEVLTS